MSFPSKALTIPSFFYILRFRYTHPPASPSPNWSNSCCVFFLFFPVNNISCEPPQISPDKSPSLFFTAGWYSIVGCSTICLPVPRALVFMAVSLLRVTGISLVIHCQFLCVWGRLCADTVVGVETWREVGPHPLGTLRLVGPACRRHQRTITERVYVGWREPFRGLCASLDFNFSAKAQSENSCPPEGGLA